MRTDSTRTTIYDTVVREFPAIAAVHKEGIPTPEPFWLEKDSSVIGAPFLVCSHVSGEPVGNLYGANEGTGVEAGHELAEALGKLHSLPVAIVPGITPQSARNATDELFTQFERRWIEARTEISYIIGQAFAWLRERLICLEGDAVIVHGDAHFSNMLMQDGKLTCMLDWEFWHTGHPAEDLAYCRPYVEQTGNWDDFLARYVAAGGRPVSKEALDMFNVWRPLRNAVLAANVSHDFQTKGDLDLETAAIGSSTYFKMEALVARALVKAIG
jgi:aminoglycoside phosphotransferase (APT) family kinase protein